jgi:hypothetical protein
MVGVVTVLELENSTRSFASTRVEQRNVVNLIVGCGLQSTSAVLADVVKSRA